MTTTVGREVLYTTYAGEKFKTLVTVKPLPGGHAIFLCACGAEFACYVSLVRRGKRLTCGCRQTKKLTTVGKGSNSRKRNDFNDMKLTNIEMLAYNKVWIIDNKFTWSRYG